MTSNTIRDLRESKGLSQTAAAELAGLTFSKYERIENGSPRTTEAEIKTVTTALNKAKKTGKKLVGRPFTDKKKQAAVEAARATGKSVAAILVTDPPAPAAKAEPAKKAPAKKAPAKKAPAKKAESELI